jgi:transcriptional regulator with XRE-family HTH domain
VEKAKRSIRANGQNVRAARQAKGWRTEDLARKAGYSKRTIENAESGKPVDMTTIVDIAEALGLDYQSLLPGAALDRKDLFRIHLVLECDIREAEHSPHLRSFIELLQRMLPADGPIKLEAVTPGSVILALEMTEEDVLRLVALFPNFHEHARAAIARTPEGRAFFRGEAHADRESVARLVDLVESVRELRIKTQEYEPPPPEPQPDEPAAGGCASDSPPAESPVSAADERHQPVEPTTESPEKMPDFPEYSLNLGGLAEIIDWMKNAESRPTPERELRLKVLKRMLDDMLGQHTPEE